MLKKLDGVVVKGYQVASGVAKDSPYEEGTIKLQKPFFEQKELCLDSFYLATLNIDTKNHKFEIINPTYFFKDLKWHPNFKTKSDHIQKESIFEILAPFISDISYGNKITIILNTDDIKLTKLTYK